MLTNYQYVDIVVIGSKQGFKAMTAVIEIPRLAHSVFKDQAWKNESIKDAIACGNNKLARYEEILKEVFGGALYLPQSSRLVADDKITPDIQWGKELIDNLIGHEKYPQLVQKTSGSTFHSAVALHRIADELRKSLPHEEIQDPEEIREQVRDINNQIQQKQDEIAALQAAGMDTGEEEEAIAQLKGQKAELGKQGKAAVEAATEQANEALPKMTRILAKAVEKAEQDAEEAEEFVEAIGWGDEPTAEIEKKTPEELLEIFLALRGNPHIKRIIKEAGRFKKLMSAVKQKSIISGQTTHNTYEYGKDIRRVVAKDLMLLATPATKPLFMDKLVKQSLMLKKFSQKAKSGKGDLFLFRDCSGSTNQFGGKINDYLAAATWAIAQTANEQGRNVEIVNFEAAISRTRKPDFRVVEFIDETYSFPGKKMPQEELLKAISYRGSGGTNWMSAINHGIEFIKKQQGKSQAKVGKMKSKFDFILLTDGSCAVGDDWVKEIAQFKKDYGVTIYAALVPYKDPSWTTERRNYEIAEGNRNLAKFCDVILNITELSDNAKATELLTVAL